MAKMATTKTKSKKDFKGVFTSLKWLAGLFAGAILALSLVVIVIWAIGVDTDNVFPISKVELSGQKYTQGGEVSAQLKTISDKGFFSIDMENVEQAISQLPWVKKVQLRKVWPETLQLSIVEHYPLAYWGANGVVSKEGEVLYPNRLPNEPWVILSGPDNLAKELTNLYEVYRAPLNEKLLKIESMHLSDRGAVSLQIAGGLLIELGKADFDKRVNRLLSNINSLKAHKERPLAKVDLRYQSGFAVSWQQVEN